MKKNFLILVLLLFGLFVHSQTLPKNKKSDKFFDKALTSFLHGDNYTAIEYCNKTINIDPNYTEPHILKAQIFHSNKKTSEAVSILKHVLEIDSNYVAVYYIIGYYLFELEEYEEAKFFFHKSLEKEDNQENKKKSGRYLDLINFRLYAYSNPVKFEPIKLSDSINTPQKEYFPTISADNNTLVFSRKKDTTDLTDENIFFSQKKDNHYQKAKNIGSSINTSHNEAASTISIEGNIMIFTRCEVAGSCNLYITQKDKNNNWSIPVKLAAPLNSRFWDSQPSLAPDGKTLYFASNRPGGKGKMDIWVSEYMGKGKWSKPQNLGDSINTEGNEMSPFIHFDSRTLYYSSDCKLGMGKFDLFYSKKTSDSTWNQATNLGYPINTKENEYRLVVDALGEKAYFSSERDTNNLQDIYFFEFPENLKPVRTIFFRAKIFCAQSKQPIEADYVTICNINDYDTVYSTGNVSKFTTCLPNRGEYALNILKKDYMFYSQNFALEKIVDSIRFYDFNIFLNPIKENETINLKNTFFDTDSYNIKPKSYVELNKLADFLLLNPTIQILVAGHTDNIGSYDYNMELSKKRAEAIKQFLIKQKIEEKRISAVGYGFTKPIANNQTESGRKQNRRTEIIILKK